MGSLLGAVSGGVDIEDIAYIADQIVHFLASEESVSIAAADGAITSLNGIVENILEDLMGELPSENEFFTLADGGGLLPFELPTIGMPIILEGEGSNTLTATGGDGYILIGNMDSIHDAISALVDDWDVDAAVEALSQGSDDFIRGGVGNDIIIGLGGNDELIGGGGNDVFVHFQIDLIGYSDGEDTITDFGKDGQDMLVFTAGYYGYCVELQDADEDGVEDDTVISFGDSDGKIILLDFDHTTDGSIVFEESIFEDVSVVAISSSGEGFMLPVLV